MGLLYFLRSPWPVLAGVELLSRSGRSSFAGGAEEGEEEDGSGSDGAAVFEAARKEFPDVDASFLPPVVPLERLRLLDALRALHDVLAVLGVPYSVLTGTLLGAARHHGFIPWDGDADVCVDIALEPLLLLMALLQRTASPRTRQKWRASARSGNGGGTLWANAEAAAELASTMGFELYAHAAKPLTYKFSRKSSPRVVGRDYGFPYVDIWFCHGWSIPSGEEGDILLQSETYGVSIKRSWALPLRRVYFAGLSLWSFQKPRSVLAAYYGEDWETRCVGHVTYHREERYYDSSSEAERFSGDVSCQSLTAHFAFAEEPRAGLPAALPRLALLGRLEALFRRAQGSARWTASSTWGPVSLQPMGRGGGAGDAGRALWPFDGGPLEVERASHSALRLGGRGPAEQRLAQHVLSDVRLVPPGSSSAAFCDVLIRITPLADGGAAGSQLLDVARGLSPRAAGGLLEGDEDERGRIVFQYEIFSAVCHQPLGDLILRWVYEDAES
eukprot:TRINITY_DN37324_c0_g1_i1.p1 TRINITY_DN37324_c0_g1~~TRINITY_DN37324_c0_g1_i1.p1  ORF type:complete len:555 (-),score=102.02 TRINITY_DN37324_c0_g1_i1:54-1553(-)